MNLSTLSNYLAHVAMDSIVGGDNEYLDNIIFGDTDVEKMKENLRRGK